MPKLPPLPIQTYDMLDPNRLELHWLEQVELMAAATKEFAEAKRLVALAEQAIKEWEAQTAVDIRQTPERYGISGRATDAAVKETVREQNDYSTYKTELIELQFKMDSAEGRIKTLIDRKAAISGLQELWIKNYYALPFIDDRKEPEPRKEPTPKTEYKPQPKKVKKKAQKPLH